jgi:hypothetical protein
MTFLPKSERGQVVSRSRACLTAFVSAPSTCRPLAQPEVPLGWVKRTRKMNWRAAAFRGGKKLAHPRAVHIGWMGG